MSQQYSDWSVSSARLPTGLICQRRWLEMTVENQLQVQRIDAYRQTPIETAWATLNSVQQARVLRAVVIVCCQIASALRAPSQTTDQKGAAPSTEEVSDERS